MRETKTATKKDTKNDKKPKSASANSFPLILNIEDFKVKVQIM